MTASQAQQRYKKTFDKLVKRVPTFGMKGLVYLSGNAPAMSTKADNTLTKLQKPKLAQYKIAEVLTPVVAQPKYITHKKDGILDTVIIDKL